MKKNDTLIELIFSMTSAEKRYFKLISQTFKDNPEHIQFFQFILNQKKNINLQLFSPQWDRNQIAQKKRYLKVQILDALRSFNKNISHETVIMNHLQNVEILYRKKFFKECLKTLFRAKKLSVKHEVFSLHLEILGWERRLISSTLNEYSVTESEISSEEVIIHEKHMNVVSTKQLHSSIIEFKKNNGYIRDLSKKKELDDFFLHFSIEELNSRRATFYYYQARTIYFWMLSDHENSYQIASKINQTFREVVSADDYFFGLLEVLTACVCTHRYIELLDRIEFIDEKMKIEEYGDHQTINDRFYYYKYNYAIISYAMLGENKKLQSTLLFVAADIELKSHKFAKQMILVLKSTIGHGAFVLGHYKMAKKIYFQILVASKGSIRNDVYNNAKLFLPIILYELGEFDLMDSEARSAMKYFAREKQYLSLEYFLINELLRIDNPSSQKERRLYANKILNRLISELENSTPTLHFEFFVLLFWTKSIVNNSNFKAECTNYFQALD